MQTSDNNNISGLREIIAELNRENAELRELVTDYALYSQIDMQSDPKGERWIRLVRRSWELARKYVQL